MVRYADDRVPRTRRDYPVIHTGTGPQRSCARDGGGPPGAALQGEAPNHREVLWLNAGVLSVAEKASKRRQVRARKANASEPCRKRSDGTKTGTWSLARDESGRNLSTAQAVSGIKVARAWLRPLHGTWETAAPIRWRVGRVPGGPREGELQAAGTARGRVPKRGAETDRPVVARKPGNAGGAKGAGYLGLLAGQPQGRSR